jgi:hypothetical protein
MDNSIQNFITKLTPTPNIRVRGVGNQFMSAKWRGVVLWKVEDNNGVVRDMLFPGTLYSGVKDAFIVPIVVVSIGGRSRSEMGRYFAVPNC